MSAPALEALSGQAGIDDVRRALAGRRALSSPHGAVVKLNADQQKRMIVFDTATIVADSDRYLPTVQSALRIVALSHPEAAERVVALPLRTVETMHAVLKGETRDENASGTTGDERFWANVLNYAAALRAADVLVRAEAGGTEIHVTVGGLRQPTPFSMHTEDAVRMCGVLYQQSSGKGEFNPTSWQRSSIAKDRLRSLGVDARITSARLQFNPAPEGVHAFIRLGDQRSLAGISFEGYRLSTRTAAALEEMRSCDAGVITHCGPPASGKTTLQALQLMTLQKETEGTRTVLLLEDTQEITNVPGVYIVPLPYRDAEERDTLLDQALEEVLRSATRTLCVGEVRGLTAARMMFQGAQTGVQVLTTLHALSAIGSVARYVRMGVAEADVFDPSINRGAVGQRLLPRLCEDCRVPVREALGAVRAGRALPGDRDPQHFHRATERWETGLGRTAQLGGGAEELGNRAGSWPEHFFLRGDGCEACRGNSTKEAPRPARGFRGRQPVIEALPFDEELLERLAAGDRRAARTHAVRELGFEPMITHASHLALDGLVSPEDVEASVGRFGDTSVLASER